MARFTATTPPPAALRAVDAAAARAEQLAREDRELHFDVDPRSGRVVIQVRDLDGRVLGALSPLAALDLLAGGEL